MRELATVQAEKIRAEKPKFAVIHRKDGDSDFISALLSELASEVLSILKRLLKFLNYIRSILFSPRMLLC